MQLARRTSHANATFLVSFVRAPLAARLGMWALCVSKARERSAAEGVTRRPKAVRRCTLFLSLLEWCCAEATLGPQLPDPGWEALYKPAPAREEAAGGGACRQNAGQHPAGLLDAPLWLGSGVGFDVHGYERTHRCVVVELMRERSLTGD